MKRGMRRAWRSDIKRRKIKKKAGKIMPYNRHVGVVSSEYDNSFKQIITAGWAEKTEGAVDEAFGHLALIPIPANEREELCDAVFYEDDSELPLPDPGYYIAQENNLGIIVVYSYASRGEMDADWANLMDELSAFYAGESEEWENEIDAARER